MIQSFVVEVKVKLDEGTIDYTLSGRMARMAYWLAEQADVIMRSHKGQVQIDYAGKDLVLRSLQTTEQRGAYKDRK
jgi:hypothetical protein